MIFIWFLHIWNGDGKLSNKKTKNVFSKAFFEQKKEKLSTMLTFHAHELFEMWGYATYKYWQTYPIIETNFIYKQFFEKFGLFFNKLLINKNTFNLYYGKNSNSYRNYSLNIFFIKRCWINKFYNNAARDDSYFQQYSFIYKNKYEERIPKYKFNNPYFGKYLNFYISNKFSQYKDLPSFILQKIMDFIFILHVFMNT